MTLQEKLLNAHCDHVMNQFATGALEKTLETELGALYEGLKGITLAAAFPEPDFISAFERHIVDGKMPEEVWKAVRQWDEAIYQYCSDNEIRITDFGNKANFDEFFQQTEATDEIRSRLVHEFVNSTMYSKLISEVLFTAIKKFVITENVLAKKIPGATKFMKLGQNFVNQNFSGLEESAERKIKDFIKKQIQDAIKNSEKFLDRRVDDAMLEKMREDVWRTLSKIQVTEGFDVLRSKNAEATAELLERNWDTFRETQLFLDLFKAGVGAIYERYGDKNLNALLKKFGWTKTKWKKEGVTFLTPLVRSVVDSGYLESRIRENLSSFYTSDTAVALLGE